MISNNFIEKGRGSQTENLSGLSGFLKKNYIIEHWDDTERPFVSGGKFDIIKDLKKSGLSPEIIKSSGLEIFEGSSDDLKKLIGFSSIDGQSLTQACSILKIPYYRDTVGNEIYCRVRLYPIVNDIKYAGKKGYSAIPYIPLQTQEIKDKKNVEIWITEGEKKALKLINDGEKAIAVGGVWNFKAGKESDETDNKELWHEIDEFLIPGRTFYIAFDMDFSKNSAVRQAMMQLALVLFNRNVNCKIAMWDSHYKGIDDYLMSENSDIIEVKQNAISILDYIVKYPEYSQEALSRLKNINFNDISKSKLQAAFKKIRILKKDFDRYANYRGNTVKSEPTETPEGYSIPSGFLEHAGKLCVLVPTPEGLPAALPICPFFTVEKIIETAENTLLSLKLDKRTIEIDAVCIGDGRELCKEFNAKGIFINGPDAKNISVYLKRFIGSNENKISKVKAYSRTGWHSDDEFLAPTICNPENIVFDSDIIRKIAIKGTAEKQIEFLKSIFAEHIGASVIICAGLAGTLIKLLNLNNYTLFTSGRTGTGKTLANQLMLSLFGNPESLKNNMNSTSVGAEMLFSRFVDTPVLLDELETSGKTAETINSFLVKLIYDFQSGVGRIRGQKNLKLRETAIYRGILFLTSERSIKSILGDNTSQKANLGIYRRVIEINDKIPLFADTVKYADIANEINKNYGHILPLWIDFIKSNLNNIKADFNKIRGYSVKNLGGKHEIVFLFNIVNLYFCKMLNIDVNNDFNQVFASIVSENSETFIDEVLNEYEKYQNAIKDFAASSGRFFNKNQEKKDGDNYRKPNNGIIGQIEAEYANDDFVLYFYTNKALEMLCKEYKLEQKRLLDILKQKDVLISGDKKGQYTIQKKIDGNPLRCYCFKLS